ncbi:MAG: acyltransferase family protein [Nitrososphaerota archaeon]|jgi:surface polysaccharide O-acyltransferase-like enzyme|nr:acyltransferase family protein [Nitrososphaerota archaeon]
MNTQKSTSTIIPVDLIRVVAIFAVLFLHAVVYASNDTFIPNGLEVLRGWIVNIYLCFGRMGVPLFVMLTGALLLAPVKEHESLSIFFKKRLSRIGLPFLFWGAVYFFWDIFIEHQQLTSAFIINGVLSGPYITFWYLYMLAGLYLLTPMLRVMVAHFTTKHFKYFICLWIVGITLIPFIKLISHGQYALGGDLFVIPLWVGYFIMGVYLVNVQIQRRILVALTVLGLALTAIATYIMAWAGGVSVFYFQEYESPTVILAVVSLFMLLNSYAKPQVSLAANHAWKYRILNVISENSLAIYLLHMIPLYLIKEGYFGFSLHAFSVDSIIGVPLLAILTLMLSLIIIIPLKKIPYLKKFIG